MFNSFWNKKKILITGNTGFKGSWLSLWLLMLGANVYGFSLKPNSEHKLFNNIFINNDDINNFSGNFFHKTGDIRNFNSLKEYIDDIQPELVFHLAAEAFVTKSYHDPLKTWETNVIGSLNLLESLKNLKNICSVVLITTDKVYKNKEWIYGYRENDTLGGHDPYSASKAAMEIAVESYRSSFCGNAAHQTNNLSFATARAGNVIGGGDWSEDRIVPDIVKAIQNKEPIKLRNPASTRPWQHVLDPLFGYMLLAKNLHEFELNLRENQNPFATAFNFGPDYFSNKSVEELVKKIISIGEGNYTINQTSSKFYESSKLNLISEKAFKCLNWRFKWEFDEAILKTIDWYKDVHKGQSPLDCCVRDILDYEKKIV